VEELASVIVVEWLVRAPTDERVVDCLRDDLGVEAVESRHG
jgi:hypothetical protein